MSKGLVAIQPDKSPADWYFVTSRGVEIARDEGALDRSRAEHRIDVDLHPSLGSRIRRQFMLGEYELAAFAAMKEVEVAVRQAASAPNSLIGVKLMQRAFGEGGELRNDELDPGEQKPRCFSTRELSACSRTRAVTDQLNSRTPHSPPR